jgi:hypothetical protein
MTEDECEPPGRPRLSQRQASSTSSRTANVSCYSFIRSQFYESGINRLRMRLRDQPMEGK